jgi:PadR family transcriptional regulator PadR
MLRPNGAAREESHPTTLTVVRRRLAPGGTRGRTAAGLASYMSIIDTWTIDMSPHTNDFPYGTLDLLLLKTLETMGPMHGYGLARRLEHMAGGLARLSQGSIYPALARLEQRRWIRARWGLSDSGREVKVYALTPAGAEHLQQEVSDWERASALVARFLEAKP